MHQVDRPMDVRLFSVAYLARSGVATSAYAFCAQERSHGTGGKADDPTLKEQVDDQRLWPFDKDNIGKIAFGITVVEYLLISDLMHSDKAVEWLLRAVGG
jgi:hypothetical protein